MTKKSTHTADADDVGSGSLIDDLRAIVRDAEELLHATEGHASWSIAVSDNGIGIDPKYFERIFQMFQRLHGHGEYAGTGIGLALVKKIVERHGGHVTVESTPGEGTTFTVHLPDRGDGREARRATA